MPGLIKHAWLILMAGAIVAWALASGGAGR